MGNIRSSTSKHSQKQKQAEPRLQPSAASPQQQSHNNPTKPENYTCEICIEPLLVSNTWFNNRGNCAHPFCADCMIKYIQAKLEDEIAEIPCPALNCTQFLDPLECQGLIGPELFIRWCDLLCLMSLLGFSRSYCPNTNCLALIVDECDTKTKEAVCPDCKYPFCFQCKLPWHTGFGCKEIGDENDRAFGELAEEKKCKRCPGCHCDHIFNEKDIRSRFVRCRCGTRFCLWCGLEEPDCECGDYLDNFMEWCLPGVNILVDSWLTPWLLHVPSLERYFVYLYILLLVVGLSTLIWGALTPSSN